MSDVHDKDSRSFNMNRIRGVDTKPEMIVRKYLHSKGVRYVLHNRNLPGRPDLTLPKSRTLFCQWLFLAWHKRCRYFVIPKTRTEWWANKIEQTCLRDLQSIQRLRDLGWYAIVVWECQLKPDKREKTLNNLLMTILKRVEQ